MLAILSPEVDVTKSRKLINKHPHNIYIIYLYYEHDNKLQTSFRNLKYM